MRRPRPLDVFLVVLLVFIVVGLCCTQGIGGGVLCGR